METEEAGEVEEALLSWVQYIVNCIHPFVDAFTFYQTERRRDLVVILLSFLLISKWDTPDRSGFVWLSGLDFMSKVRDFL